MLILPNKQNCQIYDINKILNSRKKMHTVEKLEHLLRLKDTLVNRLEIIKKYGKIREIKYEKYQDYLYRKEREAWLKKNNLPLSTPDPRA